MSQVADIVGVSEKTVYNYFPTKESMVLDWADETVESLARVIRECPPSESLTAAVVRAMKEDMEGLNEVPDELVVFLPRFMELIDSTPALRAAWLEMYDRIVTVATEALAARAEVDPGDPEPMIAARALSGLGGVALAARVRYIEHGLRGAELRDAVLRDLERAARLLETGLWSFDLLTHGRRTHQQVLDAAKAADDARAQVVQALRQARTAWRQIREETREAMREQQTRKRDAMREQQARNRQRDREAQRRRPRSPGRDVTVAGARLTVAGARLTVAEARPHGGRRRRDVRRQTAQELAPAGLELDCRLNLGHAPVEVAGLGPAQPRPEQQLMVPGSAPARLYVEASGVVVAAGAHQLVGLTRERVCTLERHQPPQLSERVRVVLDA